MSKTYQSDAMAAIHETASDLFDSGLLEKETMREFDEQCLTEVTIFSPSEIKELRLSEGVSQNVFAQYLNITKGMVSEWERGIKKPSNIALKLLTLVKKLGLRQLA